ncbi:MAG: GNAT family N-acetyltransferase [Candidatus Baltobacteraceae bacterium]
MTLRLSALSPQEYARCVLPLTHGLWGNTLTLERYIERNAEIAHSAYGRRFYGTFALCDDRSQVLASFKRYERTARAGQSTLRAFGIGAVFTPPQYRGAGYASAMLAMALDAGRAQGFDLAYLFSDIHPQFYKQLGFVELASRTISLRADALGATRVRAEPFGDRDWSAARACFSAMEAAREDALARTAPDWNLLRLRQESGDNFLVRRGKQIAAYVLGRREPKHDAYVLEELAFASAPDQALIGPLLRSAAGDLRRVTGWLPPLPARAVLARGAVRRRTSALLMSVALSAAGGRFIEAAARKSSGDFVWSADHV